MKNRIVVKRTYTKLHGKKSDVVMYARYPKSAFGGECFDADANNAYLFLDGEQLIYFNEGKVSGTDRYGKFEYRQEFMYATIVLLPIL